MEIQCNVSALMGMNSRKYRSNLYLYLPYSLFLYGQIFLLVQGKQVFGCV